MQLHWPEIIAAMLQKDVVVTLIIVTPPLEHAIQNAIQGMMVTIETAFKIIKVGVTKWKKVMKKD